MLPNHRKSLKSLGFSDNYHYFYKLCNFSKQARYWVDLLFWNKNVKKENSNFPCLFFARDFFFLFLINLTNVELVIEEFEGLIIFCYCNETLSMDCHLQVTKLSDLRVHFDKSNNTTKFSENRIIWNDFPLYIVMLWYSF